MPSEPLGVNTSVSQPITSSVFLYIKLRVASLVVARAAILSGGDILCSCLQTHTHTHAGTH